MEASVVLHYWFGDDLQSNYNTKWFPDGNSDLQSKADAEIYSLFKDLLNLIMDGQLIDWSLTCDGLLATIIVLDQFSRHIFRFEGLPADHEKRLVADRLALKTATELLEQRQHTTDDILRWHMPEFVFSLMPFRHNATVERLEFVMQQIQLKENMTTKENELLARFRKQTFRRLQHLQDRARLEATEDILEHAAFIADESDLRQNVLYKETEHFLKTQWSSVPYSTSRMEGDKIHRIAIISLSGGVDSMVICKILTLLTQGKDAVLNSVLALHIDYANRPESGKEAAYVTNWCETLGISCHVRVVNEVTRGITERDQYEKIARQIRYGFYEESIQSVINEYNTRGESVEISGVMFGHHQGDVQENIISNIMRGSSPLFLSGMTSTSLTNGVIVWRPLLQQSKDAIYAFAHMYGVPYFKDSTPSWSTRGKLRNQLLPLLKEMYGDGCMQNLSSLATESDATRSLVQNGLYQPFLESIHRAACGLSINVLPFVKQPLCFWREVLKQIMHSMGMSLVRDKSVSSFLERLQRPPLRRGWVEMRKGFHTFLHEDGNLTIIQDGVMRSNLVIVNPATTRNKARQATLHQQQTPAVADIIADPYPSSSFVDISSLFLIDCFIVEKKDTNHACLSLDQERWSIKLQAEFPGFTLPTSVDALISNSFNYGPWKVSISIAAASSPIATADKTKLFRYPDAMLLSGTYSYCINCQVPANGREETVLKLVLLHDLQKAVDALESNHRFHHCSIYHFDEAQINHLSQAVNSVQVDLRGMDIRLRDGLPWLAPWIESISEVEKVRTVRMHVSCEYTGRRADAMSEKDFLQGGHT